MRVKTHIGIAPLLSAALISIVIIIVGSALYAAARPWVQR